MSGSVDIDHELCKVGRFGRRGPWQSYPCRPVWVEKGPVPFPTQFGDELPRRRELLPPVVLQLVAGLEPFEQDVATRAVVVRRPTVYHAQLVDAVERHHQEVRHWKQVLVHEGCLDARGLTR